MAPPKKDDSKEAAPKPGTWNEWANHILAELVRLNESSKKLEEEVGDIKLELAQLKVKSSIWGAAAGALTFVSFLGVNYLKGVSEAKTASPPQPPAYYFQYAPPNPASVPANPAGTPPVNPATSNPAAVTPPGNTAPPKSGKIP